MIGVSVEKSTLPNGLGLLVIPDRHAPVVSLQGWVRFGSADETDDIAGVAHLFEHLLFKGTEKRAVGQIAQEVEGLGGDLNAYTTYDHTVMHMTLPSRAWTQGLEILADSLLHSTVDEAELERERPVILEEIKRRNDMPGAKASDLLRGKLFQGHPYARPVIGYDHVVEGISRNKIVEQYRKHYNASNLFIVVCGDVETSKVRYQVERLLGSLKGGGKPAPRPQALHVEKSLSAFAHHNGPDALLNIGWQSPSAADETVAALDALALIIGQGESSRLVRKLVHEEKLLREIGAGCWSPKDPGSFVIGMKGPAGTSAKFPRIVQAIEECLSAPLRTEELEKAKKNLLASATYSKETVDGLAQRFGYYESIVAQWEQDARYMEQISQLTLADLETVRERYLPWSRAVAAGIVPEKDSLPEFVLPKKPRERQAPNVAAAGSSKASDPSGVSVFDYHGLKVVVRTLNHLPIFSLRWVGLGGSRLEADEKAGLGSLWARTVTGGGTSPQGRTWRRKDLNEFIDQSSASLGAFHGRNSYGFQLDGLSGDFESLFSAMNACLQQPLFEKSVVSQERQHLLLDIQSAKDSPGAVVGQIFMESLFGKKHPYGRPSHGRPETLRKLGPAELLAYHKRERKEPQVLSIVGDITPERVWRALEREWPGTSKFSPTPKLGALRPSKKMPLVKKGPVETRSRLKKEQTHILWGFPSCSFFDDDRWALLGLAAVLSGQGGRLFIELRDKMSLCYTVAPTHMEGIDGGYFGFYIATSPDKEQVARDALRREVERLSRESFSETEWKKAQEFYRGSHQIDQQRFGSQATGLALDELYGFGWREFFAFDDRLSEIKTRDLKKAAEKYLSPERFAQSVVAVVGPR